MICSICGDRIEAGEDYTRVGSATYCSDCEDLEEHA